MGSTLDTLRQGKCRGKATRDGVSTALRGVGVGMWGKGLKGPLRS